MAYNRNRPLHPCVARELERRRDNPLPPRRAGRARIGRRGEAFRRTIMEVHAGPHVVSFHATKGWRRRRDLGQLTRGRIVEGRARLREAERRRAPEFPSVDVSGMAPVDPGGADVLRGHV